MSEDQGVQREAQERELVLLRNELAQAAAREEELRDEVASLKLYLNVSDNSDGPEIGAYLEGIDYLIRKLTRSVRFNLVPGQPSIDHSNSAVGFLRDFLHPKFIKTIVGSHPGNKEVNHLLCRYAIQSAINHIICKVLTQFCFGLDREIDSALGILAEATLRGEIQPVYGRWRSLLHKGARTSLSTTRTYKASMKEPIYIAINVVYQCCCLIYGQSIPQNQDGELYDAYQYEIIITDLFQVLLKMHRHIREEVISKDYRPYTLLDTKFDPKFTELADDASFWTANDEVVGCTRFGMLTSSKLGRERENVEQTVWRTSHVITVHMLKKIISDSNAQTSMESPSYATKIPQDQATHRQSMEREPNPQPSRHGTANRLLKKRDPA